MKRHVIHTCPRCGSTAAVLNAENGRVGCSSCGYVGPQSHFKGGGPEPIFNKLETKPTETLHPTGGRRAVPTWSDDAV